MPEISPKTAPKIGLGDRQVGAFSVFRARGPPGRGVLRFASGIQEARSFFDQNHDFFKKSGILGVDVIQPRSAQK